MRVVLPSAVTHRARRRRFINTQLTILCLDQMHCLKFSRLILIYFGDHYDKVGVHSQTLIIKPARVFKAGRCEFLWKPIETFG